MQLAEIHSDRTIYIFIVQTGCLPGITLKIARPIIQELWKELIGFFSSMENYLQDDCLDI